MASVGLTPRMAAGQVADRDANEERYDQTTVPRLIFSEQTTSPQPLPDPPTSLSLPTAADAAGAEGLCPDCGVVLRRGIGNPKCYRDPYDSEDDGADDEPMPYSGGMLQMAEANKGLKEVDLDGILDFDGFKYTLDEDVIEALASMGVKVNLGKKTAW